jgi:ParB-like chromosome segregation protein Spo0J
MSTFKVHPFALEIPVMLTDEYVDLVNDIKAHGLKQPLVLFEGQILDGRHRARACEDLKITPTTVNFTGTAAEAADLVASLNRHRRHLTFDQQQAFDQKQTIIDAELQRDPTQSDRIIAAKAKASPTTVGKRRAKAEGAGELSTVDSSVGADGKVRPRAKTTTKAEQPTAAQPSVANESPATSESEWNAAQAEAAALPKTAKAKFDRIVGKAQAALQKEFQKECWKHQAALNATVEERVVSQRKHYEEAYQKSNETWLNLQTRLKKLDCWMTEQEFKLVLGCLHPDRQPEDQRAKYDKAFQIFKRLEEHLDPCTRRLRANGWPNWADMPERKRRRAAA